LSSVKGQGLEKFRPIWLPYIHGKVHRFSQEAV
jgi:hypothetical protein